MVVVNICEWLVLYYDFEVWLEINVGEKFYEVRIILLCLKIVC